MNGAMEETRYWMWTRRKVSTRAPPLFNPLISAIGPTSSDHESWEEQAFAEDSSGLLGGCIWPPRSYTCSFCRREFRSAQALGGHMNVHRRDRARLKQSSSSTDESPEQYPDQATTLEYYSPNPNPNQNPNANPNSGVSASSLLSATELNLVSPSCPSFVNPISVRVPGALGLKLELGNWKVREVGSKGKRYWEEDDDIMIDNKRKRTGDMRLIGPSEVLKVSSNPIEELDLELRLGDPPKFK